MHPYGEGRSGEREPLVSVVLPAGSSPALLTEALQSILSQTYGNFEAIVVGGGAAGEAARSCSDGRIVHLPFEGEEGAPAVRAGGEAARGERIAYLDAAAVYYPFHIEALVRHMGRCGCPLAFSPAFQVLRVWVADRQVTVGKRIFFSTECDRLGRQLTLPVPLSSVMHRRDSPVAREMIGRGLLIAPEGLLVRLSEQHGFCRVGDPSLEIRGRALQEGEARGAAPLPDDPCGWSRDSHSAALEGELSAAERRVKHLEREVAEKGRRLACLEETLREREQSLRDLEDGLRVSSFYLAHLSPRQKENYAQPDFVLEISIESGEARDGGG
ncbi:MAG: glycosyltransferase [Thermodesulfovibrionales bacterium]